MGNNKQELFKEVIAAYDRLSEKYNPVVMEGAGSISELNLKHRDITNMRMALYANADTYLVADIDRGGVFASIYGTIALLPPEEKALIKGVIINKFRGDRRLFEDGRKKIEELCGIPVVGVVPYLKGLDIEQEDSVGLQQKQFRQKEGKVNVVVVLLKRLSNYTDFSALERDDRVHLFYSHEPSEIAKADIIILPGSKNTIADLIDIKNNGVAQVIVSAFYQNKTVVGICGGYQMMGLTVNDPLHVEGEVETMPGLGLLPVHTTLTAEKITRQCQFRYKAHHELCEGYEIHMGISETEQDKPLTSSLSGQTDGYWLSDVCWGSYIHGILDNKIVIDDLLSRFLTQVHTVSDFIETKTYKERQYDQLAQHLRTHIDIAYIYQQLQS